MNHGPGKGTDRASELEEKGSNADRLPLFESDDERASCERSLLNSLLQRFAPGDIAIERNVKEAQAATTFAGETEVERGRSNYQSNSIAHDTRDVSVTYDRRRFTRYKVPLGIVLRQSNDAPLYVSASDVSAGGCYVETILPLPRGTELSLVIWLESNKLLTNGIVRTSDPGVGMGIEFLDMKPEETARLERFLQSQLRSDEAITEFAEEGLLRRQGRWV